MSRFERTTVMPGSDDRRVARLRGLRALAGLLLFLATVVVTVHFARIQDWRFERVVAADLPALAGVALCLLGVMIINGVVLRDLVAAFGVRLPARTWIGLTLVGSLLNMVSPVRGGAALRALYLKRVHDVPFGQIGTVLLGSTVLSLAISAGLGAAAIAGLGVPGGTYGWIAMMFSALLAACLAAAMLIPLPRSVVGRLPAWLAHFPEAWRTLGEQKAVLWRVFGWNVIAAILHALAFVLAFEATAFTGSRVVPILSSAFARIGTLLAITPAGLGVFEAFGVVSATVAGAEAGSALVAVIIVRLTGVCVTLAGGLVMSPLLIQLISPPLLRDKAPNRSVKP